MYINKVDDFLDKIIDDFYNIIINPKFDVLKNFGGSYQKIVNDIIAEYFKKIDTKGIRDVFKNQEIITHILELLKRYLYYYYFLFAGYFFTEKNDIFINDVIDFSKNSIVNNLLDTEKNSIIIESFLLIKDIQSILSDKNKSKLSDEKKAREYINLFGEDELKNQKKKISQKDFAHIIVKSITILEIYKKKEQDEINQLFNTIEKEIGEYIYIDIVKSKKKYIDYDTVQNVLTHRELEGGFLNDIWNFVIQHENENNEILNEQGINKNEINILKLLNSKLIIPIVDDFLLYNNQKERYIKPDSAKETSINYIVTKINETTELYTKPEKALKNLNNIMSDRRAIIVNTNEDAKIISKLVNQGRRVIENNDFFNDLANYKAYTYINFKDIKKYGFNMQLNKTIDVIRSISLEKISSDIQLRVGPNDSSINIIGFAISDTLNRNLNCVKKKELINMKKLSKNGFSGFLEYLRDSKLKQKKFNSTIYWLFDQETDKYKTNTYISNSNSISNTIEQQQSNYFKIMLNVMYYNILTEIYNVIEMSMKKNTSIDKNMELINEIESKFISIPRNSDIFDKIEELLYFTKNKKIEVKYDEREDIFYGIDSPIKLPTYIRKKDNKIIVKLKLNTIKKEEDKIDYNKLITDSICQHIISWDNISNFRKSNPNKFIDQINLFINQYVMESNEKVLICKSCKEVLSIRQYVQDGEYNKLTGKYTSFSSPLFINLEDLTEYKKLRTAIRYIDKFVEKICYISNIVYFNGNSAEYKTRRKNVVKDTIDLIKLNNQFYKHKLREKIIGRYGIQKDSSDMFGFELENEIFIISSKEKDYYKNIKQNNVLAYISLLIILELNESHISYMAGDLKGVCNYGIFKKFGIKLFENLRIIVNKNKLETKKITNYPLLCYLIYNISCMMTKYKTWYYKIDPNAKIPKFNPIMQKRIIITMVDVLNSVLENSSKNNEHIFNVFNSKYYSKLSLFENGKLLESIFVEKKIQKVNRITEYKPEIYLLSHYIPQEKRQQLYKYYTNRIEKLQSRNEKHDKIYFINNITNCEKTGEFNLWEAKGKNFVSECSGDMTKIKLKIKNDENDKIIEKYKHIRLLEQAKKYCLNGELHNFNYENGEMKCIKCGKLDDYKYTSKELKEIENIVLNNENENENLKIKIPENNTISTLELSNKYNKKTKYIEKLIEEIHKIKGLNIKIGNTYMHLYDDTYIIDHDHFGHMLDKPIVLTDKDQKINTIKNHPFFGKDVLYYTNYKGKKIDIFYDMITNVLLGYKIAGAGYVKVTNKIKKIIINYSLINKLKLLGYENSAIDMDERLLKSKELYDGKLSDNEQTNIIIYDVLNYRLTNLKKVINELLRLINKSKNKLEETRVIKQDIIMDIEPNELDILFGKYKKKLQIINTTNFFKKWKRNTENLTINNDNENTNVINKTSTLSVKDLKNEINDIVLYYIISEILKLIDTNNNHVVRSNIIDFFIEFIEIIYDMFNKDKEMNNFEIKKFLIIVDSMIKTKQYEYDEQLIDIDLEKDIVPTEEAKEEKQDEIEEEDALDIDVDYEDDEPEGANDGNDGINYESRYEHENEARYTQTDLYL